MAIFFSASFPAMIQGLGITFISIFVLLSSEAQSNPAAGAKKLNLLPYYGEALSQQLQSGQTAELKSLLKEILSKPHRKRSGQADEILDTCNGDDCYVHSIAGYKAARQFMYGSFKGHLRKNEAGNLFIRDIYCNRIYTAADFGEFPSLGEGQIPFHEILNTEHSWPRSRFGVPKNSREWERRNSDMHILFPTPNSVNNMRGNLEFGEVVSETAQIPEMRDSLNRNPIPCPDSRLGHAVTPNGRPSERSYFQPAANFRGNIARAILYFSTRYGNQVDATEEFYMRKWHRDDPVDADEILRNEGAFERQGNRNPFIDHPELVELISDF